MEPALRHDPLVDHIYSAGRLYDEMNRSYRIREQRDDSGQSGRKIRNSVLYRSLTAVEENCMYASRVQGGHLGWIVAYREVFRDDDPASRATNVKPRYIDFFGREMIVMHLDD